LVTSTDQNVRSESNSNLFGTVFDERDHHTLRRRTGAFSFHQAAVSSPSLLRKESK
jgi:hypothetical protein